MLHGGSEMITVEEAMKIAEDFSKTSNSADKAWDTGDSFVIGFIAVRDAQGSVIPGQRSVVVNKKTGKAKSFFPPDYPADYIGESNRII